MNNKEISVREPLGNIISCPEELISVYVVEDHIWAGSKDPEKSRKAKQKRLGEINTVEEYFIEPARPILKDIFRHLSTPYESSRRGKPIGQGYWIHGRFGSGKSHLLSFIGALSLGQKELWDTVDKEYRGKQESLYQFYEGMKTYRKDRGIFVIARTFHSQNSDKERTLLEYLIETVKDQYFAETGENILLYPAELLSNWFIENELKLLGEDLEKFLKDPREFDKKEQWTLEEFLKKNQNQSNWQDMKECGKRLWGYYEKIRGGVPQNIIPRDPESVIKHMVERLMEKGYDGILFILDDILLFMEKRSDYQRAADEKTLNVLSHRLVHYHNLPVWTICAAHKLIEFSIGEENIIGKERLKPVPILRTEESYNDMVLMKIRQIKNSDLIEPYWEDYRRGFTWPEIAGKSRFENYFPFHPDVIEIMKYLSSNLATIRSGLDILHQILKTHIKKKSNEMIAVWRIFEELLLYGQEPSVTTEIIACIRTIWHDEWKSFERAEKHINSATGGYLKLYNNRCIKILQSFFLYNVAEIASEGLISEDIMNCVMEWRDHEKLQKSDIRDNQNHYEILIDKIRYEIPQINKVNERYLFNPSAVRLEPMEVYSKVLDEVKKSEIMQRKAWEYLLCLGEWKSFSNIVFFELFQNNQSIFNKFAPSGQEDVSIIWHGRKIHGRIFMRDLPDIYNRNENLPSLDTFSSGLDFFVFISSAPCEQMLKKLASTTKDPRIIFWSPAELTPSQRELFMNFAIYCRILEEYQEKDTEEAREIINWVQDCLKKSTGLIYIVPDAYSGGKILSLNHSSINITWYGQILEILTPVITLVLDSVYKSKELDFKDTTPFDSIEAINVINGIVKTGELDIKKDDNLALQNYAYSLGIMKKRNNKKFDISGNEFIDAIDEWIEKTLQQFRKLYISVDMIYKNFTGLSVPGGLDYGLSWKINYGLPRRIIQLYLLCLVRECKIKISLKGSKLPFEYIERANMGSIDFNTSILESFDSIYPVKSPEGWHILAPFAAVLFKDTSLISLKEEVYIKSAIKKFLDYRKSNYPVVKNLSEAMNDLFTFIKMENTSKKTIDLWLQFLFSPIDRTDIGSSLRNILEKTFAYQVYSSEYVRQEELNDFRAKFQEIEKAMSFCLHREKIKTIYEYCNLPMEEQELAEIKENISALREKFENIGSYMENESRLLFELLNPGGEVIRHYIARYLKTYGKVAKIAAQARERISRIERGKNYKALQSLCSVEQLGGNIRSVRKQIKDINNKIFYCPLSRQEIELKLNKSPYIKETSLSLVNANELIATANKSMEEAEHLVRKRLREKALLLVSGTLRDQLKEGRDEKIIKKALSLKDEDSILEFFIENLSASPELIDIFKKYLVKIQIKKIKLSDFVPSRKTIKTREINEIVEEFRNFIEEAIKTDSTDEVHIVEFE
ncbi:MAG TPA: hypothetical protein PL110_07755 [Candidatus Eremiobacteraeota bacterium]|nr:MAG: hypothetical protein BWY64_00308 [bacterium ADurb.Bin363]HPZ07992.1 hypothetical protein [Candidatus Eremiobacteraeota bacterium]